MKPNSILKCTIISLVLWSLTGYVFFAERKALTPDALLNTLQKSLNDQERAVDAVLSNEGLSRRLWTNSLSEADLLSLEERNLVFKLYDSTGLVFWSRNDFPVQKSAFLPDLTAVAEPKVFFLYRSYGNRLYLFINSSGSATII
jgi:hypothetical protein